MSAPPENQKDEALENLVERVKQPARHVPTLLRYFADLPRAFDNLRAQKTRDAVTQAKKHRGITDAVEVLGARIKDLKLGPNAV